MNPEEQKAVNLFYERAANGSADALQFLQLFHSYSHEIDDFLDQGKKDYEALLEILAHANTVYSCSFYSHNAHRLHMVVAQITNAFADSVLWEKDRETWKKNWADTLRFAGNEMVLAVAMIEGGFPLMRELSPLLKELAWGCHHDGETPV